MREIERFLSGLLAAGVLTGLVLIFQGQIRGWFGGTYDLVPNVVGAIIVGGIGSTAYYTALKLGYIGGEQRDKLLSLFGSGGLVIAFCLIGGGIAAIFQLAQIAIFAPVQAFVLGITWPTLVSQYVAAAKEMDKQKLIDQMKGYLSQ